MKTSASKTSSDQNSEATNKNEHPVEEDHQLSNLFLQAQHCSHPVISNADDPNENEADKAANQILLHDSFNVARQLGQTPSNSIQRVSDRGMPSAFASGFSPPDSGGSKLPVSEKNYFEDHFGSSLDDVRLHTDSAAGRAARSIGAQAFTFNNHIAFAPGRYSSNTHQGRWLLAHELAHVIQQRGVPNQLVQRLGDNPATDAWVERRGREIYESHERERRTREAWESSHRSRFRTDLGAEGTSLREEINRSDTALIGLRAQSLARLSRTTVDIPLLDPGTVLNEDMPENMDVTYGAARLAIDTLGTGLIADEPLDLTLIDAITGPINSFYYTAVEFAQSVEAVDRARAERDAERYTREMASYTSSMEIMRAMDSDPVDRRATAMTGLMMRPDPAYQAAPLNSPALETLAETARNASSDDDWQMVFEQFAQAERHVDQALILGLRSRAYLGGAELRQGLEHYTTLRTNQERLRQEHPSAIRIQAIFYPESQMVVAEGSSVSVAHGIPWQLYLYHTASEAPGGVARATDHWQLRDLTSGRSLPSYPSSLTDSAMVAEGGVVDPPATLFGNFAEIVEFPDGIFYWTMPSGETWNVPTSDDWGLWEWLQAIGIGIAALAIIAATAGAAAPVVAGLGVASAGFGVASTLAERSEKQRLGTWSEADEERAYVSIGADIISALSMGLGAVVTAASRGARVATFAAANARAFGAMRRGAQVLAVADVGGSMAQITYASADLIRAFQAVQNQPGLSDEERERAIGRLALTALMVGTMGYLSVRGGVSDFSAAGGRVHLTPDEDGVMRVAREGIDTDLPNSRLDTEPGPHAPATADSAALPVRDLDAELRAVGSDPIEMAGPVRVDSGLVEGDVRIDFTRSENGLVESVQFRIPEGFDPHSTMGADLLRVHNDVVRAFSGVIGRFRLAIVRFQAALRGVDPPPLHLQMELWKHRRLASLRMERAAAAHVTREQLIELQTDLANIERRIDDISDAIANPARWSEYSASSVGTFGRIPGTEHLPPLPPNHQWDVGSDGVIRMRPRAGHTGPVFDVEYGPGGAPTGRLTNAGALNTSGVLGMRLVNPANGAVNQTLARALRRMGYDVSPRGVISLAGGSGAGAMARGHVVLPLAVDAAGNIRMTGVHYGGDLSRFSDADLMTAGTGGIVSIEMNRSPTPGFGNETVISGSLLDRLPRSGAVRPGRAPSFNDSFPYRPGELGLGGRFEIAHLWGPGFGDEAAAGMALAPRSLNQLWQNRGIEDLLRSFRDEGRAIGGGEVRLVATAREWDLSTLSAAEQDAVRALSSVPDIDMLQAPFLREVRYEFVLVNNGTVVRNGPRVTLTVNGPPPSQDVSPEILGGWGFL
jgi:hypothetical protein